MFHKKDVGLYGLSWLTYFFVKKFLNNSILWYNHWFVDNTKILYIIEFVDRWPQQEHQHYIIAESGTFRPQTIFYPSRFAPKTFTPWSFRPH